MRLTVVLGYRVFASREEVVTKVPMGKWVGKWADQCPASLLRGIAGYSVAY